MQAPPGDVWLKSWENYSIGLSCLPPCGRTDLTFGKDFKMPGDPLKICGTPLFSCTNHFRQRSKPFRRIPNPPRLAPKCFHIPTTFFDEDRILSDVNEPPSSKNQTLSANEKTSLTYVNHVSAYPHTSSWVYS
jgi:hypothetical protein